MVESMDQLAAMLAKSATRLADENKRLRARLSDDVKWLKLCVASLRERMSFELDHLDKAIDLDRERLERIEARLDALEARRCSG